MIYMIYDCIYDVDRMTKRPVEKVQGRGRVCIDSYDLCVKLHSYSHTEIN